MFQRIKNFLKRFLPPPVRAFNREVERILATIFEGHKETNQAMKQLEANLSARLETISTEQSRQMREERNALMQQMIDLSSKNEMLLKQISEQAEEIDRLQSQLSEAQTSIVSGKTEILKQINGMAVALTAEIVRLQGKTEESIAVMKTDNIQRTDNMLAVLNGENEKILQLIESTQHQHEKLRGTVEAVHKQAADGSRNASEAVWAEIFNNAISGSSWLTNTTFSPGRWAVGYPVLYVMYRILNEVRPKRILELGLGQSTRMIGQYAPFHEGVKHIVVEHDPEWISFFENDFQLSARSKIVRLDREMVRYKEAEAVRVFKGFRETFSGQKFDFISIDAPLGGDIKQYARIDVLGLLPDCLSDDFVIMIDDAERSEKRIQWQRWRSA